MSIKNNCLYGKNNSLYFLTNEKSVLLLNFDDYESLCNNIKENKIFSNIISKLDIDDIRIIKEQFLPLFNYIILNNISIYISDNCNGSLYVENKNLSNNKGEEFLRNILKFLTKFYTNIDIIYNVLLIKFILCSIVFSIYKKPKNLYIIYIFLGLVLFWYVFRTCIY